MRPAEPSDIPVLVEMGRKFHAAAGLSAFYAFDPASFAQTLSRLLESPDGAVFVTDGGMIGGLAYPLYLNAHHKCGQELFWWVEPERRGRGRDLMATLEDWGRSRGASSFTMIALESQRPEAVGRLYRRAGYAPVEHTFVRSL